jgi:hypothetical protein
MISALKYHKFVRVSAPFLGNYRSSGVGEGSAKIPTYEYCIVNKNFYFYVGGGMGTHPEV